jgi:multiple sugar transport system permease protein
MLMGIPTAYGIARFKAGGKNFSFFILLQRMLPPIAAAIPLFLLFSRMGLVDTHVALIIVYSLFNLPFAIWLLIGFFQDFPIEIEEAALIDGCTRLQALIRVVIPGLSSAILVVALFITIFAWNEFLFAFVLTRSSVKTWMILISSFQSPQQMLWGEAAAAAIVGSLPGFIFVLTLRKYLVRGLTMGGIK